MKKSDHCYGKPKLRTLPMAEKVRKRMVGKHGSTPHEKLTVYFCHECKGFHIGGTIE